MQMQAIPTRLIPMALLGSPLTLPLAQVVVPHRESSLVRSKYLIIPTHKLILAGVSYISNQGLGYLVSHNMASSHTRVSFLHLKRSFTFHMPTQEVHTMEQTELCTSITLHLVFGQILVQRQWPQLTMAMVDSQSTFKHLVL